MNDLKASGAEASIGKECPMSETDEIIKMINSPRVHHPFQFLISSNLLTIRQSLDKMIAEIKGCEGEATALCLPEDAMSLDSFLTEAPHQIIGEADAIIKQLNLISTCIFGNDISVEGCQEEGAKAPEQLHRHSEFLNSLIMLKRAFRMIRNVKDRFNMSSCHNNSESSDIEVEQLNDVLPTESFIDAFGQAHYDQLIHDFDYVMGLCVSIVEYITSSNIHDM